MNRSQCIARAYDLADAHANAYEDHITALVASGADALTVDDPIGDRLWRIVHASADALGLTARAGADAPDVLLWRTAAELPDEALATVTDAESARAAIAAATVALIGVELFDRAMLTTDYELCHLYLSTTPERI